MNSTRLHHMLLGGLTAAALTAATLAAPPAALAQSDDSVADVLLDPTEMARVEAAVDKGLNYLMESQRPDGSWPCWSGTNNAINALGLLAYLGRGHVPGRGPYQPVVDRAIAFILATQTEQGLFRSPNPSHGPMYEHGLATLAIIEAYGSLPSPQMRAAAQAAVDLIVKSQSKLGGWRYQPQPADADLSVSVMQIVALRAAMNARLNVPVETVEQALTYVKACASARGGFSYQPGGGPNPAQSAAGTLSMCLLGAFDDPSVDRGLDYIAAIDYKSNIAYFYYTTYYAMQATFQAGGDRWAQWHPKVRQILLDSQNTDGSWPGFGEQQYNGPAFCYSTAMACIALEVYMHYLPAYQR